MPGAGVDQALVIESALNSLDEQLTAIVGLCAIGRSAPVGDLSSAASRALSLADAVTRQEIQLVRQAQVELRALLQASRGALVDVATDPVEDADSEDAVQEAWLSAEARAVLEQELTEAVASRNAAEGEAAEAIKLAKAIQIELDEARVLQGRLTEEVAMAAEAEATAATAAAEAEGQAAEALAQRDSAIARADHVVAEAREREATMQEYWAATAAETTLAKEAAEERVAQLEAAMEARAVSASDETAAAVAAAVAEVRAREWAAARADVLAGSEALAAETARREVAEMEAAAASHRAAALLMEVEQLRARLAKVVEDAPEISGILAS